MKSRPSTPTRMILSLLTLLACAPSTLAQADDGAVPPPSQAAPTQKPKSKTPPRSTNVVKSRDSSPPRRAPKPPVEEEEVSSLTWLSFHAEGLLMTQSGGSQVTSFQPAWTPSLWLSDFLSLRADLGGTLLKGATGSLFTEFGAGLFVTYTPLSWLAIEPGGGIQYWISNGGLAPMVGGNLAWLPKKKLLSCVDRIYAGYSHLFATVATEEIRAGVGVTF